MARYLHNTTFIVETSAVEAFIDWARTVYLPAIKESGRFESATMARILLQVEEGVENYAVQMVSTSLEDSAAWHADVAALLKDDLSARLGQRVVFFSTDMEIIS